MTWSYKEYWLARGRLLKDRYRIEDIVDEGGMGIVYLGFDMVLQCYVSIKEYFPRNYAARVSGKTDIAAYKGHSCELYQQGLDKFVDEARIQSRFETMESIVMVKDFFYENQTAYIVMEHVKGENLKQFIERNGCMKPQKVLDIMKPILEALGKLHREGLIHRDISPDNIILTKEDKGVLIDFGAARFSDSQEDKTMTVFFKRGYSAEEQYVEKSEKGAYTDIYSVCATMYFCMTGIRQEESVRRLIRDTVVPLSKFPNIKLDNYRKKCIMKGMSVEAKNRYSSMQELCQVLYERDKRPKNRWKVIVLAVILFFVMGMTSIAGWQKTKCSAEKAKTEPKETESVTGQFVQASPVNLPTPSNRVLPTAAPKESDKMVSVAGMKKNTACAKLKVLNKGNIVIKLKWEYSTKQKKGRVIRQSIKAGTELISSKKYTVVLTISRGAKPVPTKAPDSKPTVKPTQAPAKNSVKEDFAGKLPW